MSTRNETIIININDTAVRNLEIVLSDLNTTLGSLQTTLNNSTRDIQNVTNGLAPLEAAVNTSRGAFDTLERTLRIATIPFDNIQDNIGYLIGATPLFTTNINAAAGAVGKLSVAKGILSAVLKALPFVGVIALVGSLAVNLGRLITRSSETEDGLEDLRTELDANRAAHDRNIRSIRTQVTAMDTLIDTIEELSEESDLGAAEQNKLRLAVIALNDATSGFELTLDDLTEGLSENSKEVLANMRAYHQVNGAIKESNEHIGELISLHGDKAYAEQAVTDLEGTYEDLNEQISETKTQIGENATAMLDLIDPTEDQIELNQELLEENINLNESLSEMYDELGDVETALEEYGLTIENATERIEELEGQMTESMEVMAQAVYDGTWRQIVSWDQLTESQQEAIGDLVETYEWLSEGALNALEKMEHETDATLASMIATLDHNSDQIEAWGENLATIYDKVGEDATEGFMAWIEDMGRENPAILEMLAGYTDDELQGLVTAYEQNAEQINNTLATAVGDEFDQVRDLFDRFGPQAQSSLRESVAAADFANPGGLMSRDVARGILDARPQIEGATEAIRSGLVTSATAIVAGFAAGISSGSSKTRAAAVNFANSFIEPFRNQIQENSPSRVFRTSGENIVAGLVQGITTNQARSVTLLTTLATNMRNTMNNQQTTYQNIGRDIMTGLNQGLLNGESTVMSTARRIADNIARTMRTALDINSPSRVMRETVGRHIPEGVAAGIDKYADDAIDSVYALGKELLKVNIPNINEMISMGPSLSMAAIGANGSSTYDQSVTNNNSGLFNGATINWHGEGDIRRTMEKIAWVTERERARMW